MDIEKINKLRTMAERGEPGEQANAKRILDKLGIDWKKPKNSFTDRVKSTFGMDIRRTYHIGIKYSTDILLIMELTNRMASKKSNFDLVNNKLQFTCTEAESKDIMNIFSKYRNKFSGSMSIESSKYIDSYLMK